MNWLWKFLENFWLTRSYINNVQKSIRILFPQNRDELVRQTRLWLAKSFAVFAGIVIFMSSFCLQFYWVAASVLLAACIIAVWSKGWSNRVNVAILKELQGFVNEISFAYRCSGELEEAFRQVLMDAGGLMKLHGELIYENISSASYEDTYRSYKKIAPNEFFLLFYAISHKVKEEGDTFVDGSSQYNNNLILLSKEISNHINFISKTKNAFSGLMGMCIFPVLFIRPIELWTVSNLPELEGYFESTQGRLCSVVVFVLSLLVLEVVSLLKYPDFNQKGGNELIGKLSHHPFISDWMNRKISKRYGYYYKLWRLLKKACSEKNVIDFCIKRYVYAVGCGIFFLVMGLNIGLGMQYVIAVSAAGVLCGYWYVYGMLYVKMFVIKSQVRDELIRLYTIVGMSIRQENMDIRGLLVQLELISVYYEPAFSQAVHSYEGSGSRCLNELRENVADKDIGRLVEGLVACDDLGVNEAMMFVDAEREYLIEAKHIRDEKALSDRSALAKFVAFVPFLTTIIVKLIIPFIMEGLRQLENFNGTMELF